MSAVAERRVRAPVPGGPGLWARIAAIAVLVALAGLAAYAVFAGPTTVPVKAPAGTPTRIAPAASQGEPDREGVKGD